MKLLVLSQWRHLLRTPGSTIATVVGVTLGVTSIVAVHLVGVRINEELESASLLPGYTHVLAGNISYLKKEFENGIRQYEKAVELNPNGADAHAFLARGLDLIGKTEEAIQMSDKAIRLNPIPPNYYIVHRTAMYRNIKNYDEALIWAKKAVSCQRSAVREERIKKGEYRISNNQ